MAEKDEPFESIFDRLRAPEGDTPGWSGEPERFGDEEMLPVADIKPALIDVSSVPQKSRASVQAKRFLELISNGVLPNTAAENLNENLPELRKDATIRKGLKLLVEQSRFPAEVRKEMVRAGLNKLFMENINGSLKEQKVALEASKQIAKDPETGLTTPNIGPQVHIDMGALTEMLQKMKPIAGLEDITVETAPPDPRKDIPPEEEGD